MKRSTLKLLLEIGTMTALSGGGQALGAGVELRPGVTVEFASLVEGRRILAERDISRFSPFDCCVRMRTSAPVTPADYLAFMTNQVVTWTASEISQLSGMLQWVGTQTRNLNLVLPNRFYLVKTTGNEEGNSAYVLGTHIVLPQAFVSGDANQLRKVLAHELFHVYLAHNPQMRGALYNIIGFRLCEEIPLPQWLVDRRITSTGPDPWNFVIQVKVEEERVPALLVFYSKSTNYTSGQLFDYLVSQLLVLEPTGEGYRASCLPDGTPRLLDPLAVPRPFNDYWEQIGGNTSYQIHPEEILAENFVLVVGRSNAVYSPRIPYQLKNAINHPSSASVRLPAGRFRSGLAVDSTANYVIEASPDLVAWKPIDYVTNVGSALEVIDADAWVYDHRFYRARESAPPILKPGDTNQMVWLPPGTFLMGSPPNEANRRTDEGPQTEVTLTRGFWMGRYEVTQAEYELVMGTNTSHHRGLPNLPVENVTWEQAEGYCSRLTELAREEGRLPASFAYRLPTEAEREYAARAGTTTRFTVGDDPDLVQMYTQEWFCDNAGFSDGINTHPVGTKPANPWGLHDMQGNVCEWCADWYGPYAGGKLVDPSGPAGGTYRVLRGASAGAYVWSMSRSAARTKSKPNLASFGIGFRVVLAPVNL